MSWHVIRAFEGVAIVGSLLRYIGIEVRFQIICNFRRRIFIDRERRGRVLDEHMGKAGLNFADVRDGRQNVAGNQMKPSRFRAKGSGSFCIQIVATHVSPVFQVLEG